MGAPTEVLGVFTIALVCSLALLPLLRNAGGQLGLIDLPGSRRVHVQPIPKTGGIAVVLGVLISLVPWLMSSNRLMFLTVAMVMIAILGLLDDLKDIRARYELMAQALLACAVVSIADVAAGGFFSSSPVMGWLVFLVSVVFIVGVTNAINMSDGLDGLAAGSTIIVYLMLAALAYQVGVTDIAVLSVALVGSLIGFLCFNTHPARIFLGDTGSQFLGFGAATIAVLLVAQPEFAANPAMMVLLFGIPILDTSVVVVTRWRAKTSIFSADKRHIHHRLLAAGLSQTQVVAVMYALQGGCAAAAYALRFEHAAVLLGFYLLLCALVIGVLVALDRRHSDTPSASQNKTDAERRNPLFRDKLAFLHRRAHIIIGLVVCLVLLGSAYLVEPNGMMSAWVPLVIGMVLAAVWLAFPSPSIWLGRVITFSAIGIIGLGFQGVLTELAIPYAIFVAIVLGFGALLALAVRVTRKEAFRLDAQDALIFLILLLFPVVSGSSASTFTLVEAIIGVILLVYAAEFVLCRGRKAANALMMSSILSLCTIGWLGAVV